MVLLSNRSYRDYDRVVWGYSLGDTQVTGLLGLLTRGYTDYGDMRGYIVSDNRRSSGRGTDRDTRSYRFGVIGVIGVIDVELSGLPICNPNNYASITPITPITTFSLADPADILEVGKSI